MLLELQNLDNWFNIYDQSRTDSICFLLTEGSRRIYASLNP